MSTVSAVTIDDYRWLTGNEALRWLRDLAATDGPLHQTAGRLRRQLDATRVHLLLEQVELRQRAAKKFVDPQRMLFTRQALEQATDEWVARYKATRFANCDQLTDLCCGIGGDLLALAEQGNVCAIDRDPVCLQLAEHNVGIRADYVAIDVANWQPARAEVWHLDPDRRPHDGRTSQLNASSPSARDVERLLDCAPSAAIKLAPAAVVPERWHGTCELEWISRNRECKQLVAWHGELTRQHGVRRATVLRRISPNSEQINVADSLDEIPAARAPIAECIGPFIHVPDPAVMAAGLVDSLAVRTDACRLAVDGAYLTSDHPSRHGCSDIFEVVDVLPLDRRKLARYVAARNIGTLEIKTSGVDILPEQLRTVLKPRGENSATFLITRVGKRRQVAVSKRVETVC